MNFDQIILEPEQQDLFIRMVEMIRNVTRENRSPMIEANSFDGTCLIMPKGEIKGYAHGDPGTLTYAGLLSMDYGSSGSRLYTISPIGFKYYDWLIKQQGKPVERIEKQTFRYLEFEDFRNTYVEAYRKIKKAEEMLWSADEKKQHSQIGICCRDAMQDFADQLYRRVLDKHSEAPKNKTVSRIRTTINARKNDMGETIHAFLDALLSYWGTASDLVQRNAHANEKEGEPINMEDSRRVVFQTVNVMVELHRTLDMK